MFWVKDIEWVRAYTKKNQIKTRKANIERNYKRIYREIKRRAKLVLIKLSFVLEFMMKTFKNYKQKAMLLKNIII